MATGDTGQEDVSWGCVYYAAVTHLILLVVHVI